MSSTGESSENSRTLPRAELNPLLNPILASHMGRWAEVYFTSPPEKREEAVLELLRELEAEESANPSATALESIDSTKYFQPANGNGRSLAPVQPLVAQCPRCGHDNPTTHQFCGMCGASVQPASSGEFRTDSPYGQHQGEMENHESERPFHSPLPPLSEAYMDEPPQSVRESRSDPYDLSLLQGLREREIDDYEYDGPSSRRYRYYIGAVLTILLLLLGYMAWRSGQISQNSHQASAPPPAAPAEGAPAPQATAPKATAPQAIAAPSVATKVAEPPASQPGTNAAEAAKEQNTVTTSHPAAPAQQNSPTSPNPSTMAGAEAQFSSSSGAEDLAMAQRYLAGTNGQARNPAEAAKWLWKAMGKHNGPAALQLADLYLKGDGVTKNCEQARILLDSAAIRGLKGAGERLRNIQAFGCQ